MWVGMVRSYVMYYSLALGRAPLVCLPGHLGCLLSFGGSTLASTLHGKFKWVEEKNILPVVWGWQSICGSHEGALSTFENALHYPIYPNRSCFALWYFCLLNTQSIRHTMRVFSRSTGFLNDFYFKKFVHIYIMCCFVLTYLILLTALFIERYLLINRNIIKLQNMRW